METLFGEGQLWLPIALMLLGAVIVFFEIFIPSGGILAIAAGICIVSAIVMVFKNQGAALGLVFVLITMLLLPAVIFFAMKIFPETRMGKKLILQHSEEGFNSQDTSENELLGQTGVTVSMLRPVGVARFGNKRIDVMTDGELIEKDKPIEVRRVEGNRIIVREIKEAKTDKA